DRTLRHHVARVIRRRVAEVGDDAVVVHVVVVILDLHLPEPLVPTGGDVGRQAAVAVEVLADEAGAISRRVQPGGDGGAVVEDLRAAVRRLVGVYARAVRILAGQDAGAARATQRGGHVTVGEGHARVAQLARHPRHHRSGPVGGLMHRIDGIPALIVRQDDDEVRPLLLRERRSGGRQEQAEREQRGQRAYRRRTRSGVLHEGPLLSPGPAHPYARRELDTRQHTQSLGSAGGPPAVCAWQRGRSPHRGQR